MLLTQMEKEACAAPDVLAKQFAHNRYTLQALCARLQCYPPQFAMTIARGSSDHAATFAKYLFETYCGWVTASAAPSVVTLYHAKLHLRHSLVIAISQSGQSPDITEMLHVARQAGAVTVALVNEENSPLATVAEYVLPLCAGPEKAVAATKSYMASLGALIQWIAMMTQHAGLQSALMQLPHVLRRAITMDWSPAISLYQNATDTFVIGRGYGYPIAQEAALKFKETANIHAEPFSSAEVLHGPSALIQKDFPLLVFAQRDASFKNIATLTQRVKDLGAKVLLAVPGAVDPAISQDSILLPLPEALHPLCDPLMMIQAFYIMMARLSVARGLNPDQPLNLTKVTKTW